MGEFKKITEEILYGEEFDIKKYLDVKTYTLYFGNSCDVDMQLQESFIDCESPIEQILSVELEWIGLKRIYEFNPYIDVLGIEKQKEIICNNKKYRVDFYIPVTYKNQETKFFIIECDGHEFHQKTKEQVEKDNERNRELQKAGYDVIRFSGTEIWHKPYRCACEVRNIILSKCNYVKEKGD